MIKILFILFFITVSFSTYSQIITYKDLIFIMNNEETEKIDDLLNMKGFMIGEVKEISETNECVSFDWNYENKENKKNNIHVMKKLCYNNNKIVTYSSTNSKNYLLIKSEIIKLGYKKNGENYNGGMLNTFYKKGKYSIHFGKKNIGDRNDTQYLIILSIKID